MLARRLVGRVALGAALALSFAACAHPATSTSSSTSSAPRASEREALFLSAWQPPSGQRCAAVPLPVALPVPEQVVDADAVHAVLDGTPALAAPGAYALLSLRFDAAGEVARSVVIETSLADSARDRVSLAVANGLRPQGASPAPWGVRLRVDGGAPPRLRVGRAEWCDAAPTGRGPSVYRTERLGRARSDEPSSGPTIVQEPARWRVVVDASGKVTSAVLLTATHYPDFVQQARESVMQLRFLPALDDRVPVAAVDTIEYAITGAGRD